MIINILLMFMIIIIILADRSTTARWRRGTPPGTTAGPSTGPRR